MCQHQELAPRPCISTADAPLPFLRPVMSQGGFELRASGNDIGQEDRAWVSISGFSVFRSVWGVTYLLNLSFPTIQWE